MRLIDANKITYYEVNAKAVLPSQFLLITTKASIDETPTVEAIPIEWLKDFFANIEYEMRMNNEKITSDKIGDLVEYMIAKWSEQKGNWENG